MYQSMFLLGILAFGFFSVTFNNYTTEAEDLVQENNLKTVTQQIGLVIMDLIDTGNQLTGKSASFQVTVPIHLSSEIAGTSYSLNLEVDASGDGLLTSYIDNEAILSFNMGFKNNTEVFFDAARNLISSSPNQAIQYTWDGTTQTIAFIKL